MMQEEYKEFDSLVRSMLENAEVKPSRSVWKGIACRIKETSPGSVERRGAGAMWGYACMALAAASVLLGVFFFHGRTPENSAPVSSVMNYSADASVSHDDMPAPDKIKEYVRGGLMPENVPVVDMLAMAELEERIEEETQTPVLETEADETSENQQSPENASPPGRTVRKAQQFEYDPFGVPEEMESKSFFDKPIEVYTKGAVGGNDSGLSVSHFQHTFAPGITSDGIVETGTSVYGVPVSFGVGVRKYVSPRLSVGTGVDYTRLSRTFAGKYVRDGLTLEAGTISHVLQYVGIPLELYYNLIGSDRLRFYVHAGGEAEFCVSSRYTLFAKPDITVSETVRKLQYSVGGGVGVEFVITPRFGLYVDPSVRYYFPCTQPKSVRTEHPLLVNFDIGARFSF